MLKVPHAAKYANKDHFIFKGPYFAEDILATCLFENKSNNIQLTSFTLQY